MRFPDCLANARDRRKHETHCRELATVVHDSVDFLIAAWEILAGSDALKECPSHTTVLMQCRNVVELLDGVEILVREGSALNCFHQLRSTCEAYWGVLWVLDEDTERRGKAYQVWHAHRTMAFTAQFDTSTDVHARLRSRVSGQEHAQIFDGARVDSEAVKERKLRLLSLPEYRETAAEWERAVADRKNKPGFPFWYSLFGGPKHVGALAARVGQRPMYEVFYGFYSDAIHAGNAFDHLAPLNDGSERAVRPVRHPGWLSKVACQASQLAVLTSRAVLGHYAPQQVSIFGKRYVERLRARIQRLTEGDRLIANWH